MDHVNIYILIAGTYTPFCLTLPRETGRTLLVLIWESRRRERCSPWSSGAG